MSGKKKENVSVRLDEIHFNFLKFLVREGSANDRSESIRFCIDFTNAMFGLLPAAIFEAIVEIEEEKTSFCHEEGLHPSIQSSVSKAQ